MVIKVSPHPRLVIVLVVCISLIFTGISQASYQFGFDIFTTNGDYNDDPGLDMYMVVSNGAGKSDFTFYNNSSVESCIANIYFDDGTLLGISSITNSTYTLFSQGGSPGDLPSGNTIGFYADSAFNSGATAPAPNNGVCSPPPGLEWVKISFDLQSGGTIEDVVQELNTGQLRVGLHIINLPDGSSESAVSVPEPATLFLLTAGAIALRKKRRN